MSSLLAQASNSRPLQLAATAVVSGAVAVGVLLGVQHNVQASRLRRLKRSVANDVAVEEAAEVVGGETAASGKLAQSKGGDHNDLGELVETEDPEELRALALARRAQAGDYAEEVILEQLTRNQAFLTPAGLQKVRDAVVVVVGCGGVGSHCAAALARSGVARIRLVDFDQVSLSSLNRHAVATLADVGRPKVRVLSRRLLAVAPWVRFDLRGEKFDKDSAERLLGSWRDADVEGATGADTKERPVSFIVDAIDNIDTKVELLRYCYEHKLPIIASMGAGTKSDPTRVVLGDIGSSAEDRLSRATRRRLKLLGITGGIPAVYSTERTEAGDGKAALLPLSDEQFAKGKDAVRELGALPDFRVRILPVLGTMPAVFGYTLANHILLVLSGYPHDYTAVKGRDKLYDQILAAVHGFEEKMVRHFEEAGKTVNGESTTEDATPAPVEDGNKKGNKNKKGKKKAVPYDANSAAVGLRVPLTSADVAFLIEEVYRGRSAVSGLPTRTTLVRWQLPERAESADVVESLLDRVRPAAQDLEGDVPLQAEQKTARLQLADLVCMTREEASRHQDLVLFKGQPLSSLYDEATLARIEARRHEAADYEKYR